MIFIYYLAQSMVNDISSITQCENKQTKNNLKNKLHTFLIISNHQLKKAYFLN